MLWLTRINPHQITLDFFQECWSIHIIQKVPDATPCNQLVLNPDSLLSETSVKIKLHLSYHSNSPFPIPLCFSTPPHPLTLSEFYPYMMKVTILTEIFNFITFYTYQCSLVDARTFPGRYCIFRLLFASLNSPLKVFPFIK